MHRIMYICTECEEHAPENCGHFDRTEVRVMPDGRWLCDGCYDDERSEDMPPFNSLPPAPAYGPIANQ